MPRVEIDRGINFIIEDEGWQLIEYDYTSVSGIIYLSLTENKVNLIYDDLIEDIADTDRLAQYRIDLPPLTQHFKINDSIQPVFTLFKNGLPVNIDSEEFPIKWKSEDKKVVRIIDDIPIAVGEGETKIIPYSEKYSLDFEGITVIVDGAKTQFSAYIKGNDSIRLDRYCSYVLDSSNGVVDSSQVSCSIEMLYSAEEQEKGTVLDINDYAEIFFHESDKADEPSSWIIHANKKNKLHDILLKAVYNGQEYTKPIKIIPLW